MAAQALPTSSTTARVVHSLATSDNTFAQQLHWVGDYDLGFLAKVPFLRLLLRRKCLGAAGRQVGLMYPKQL